MTPIDVAFVHFCMTDCIFSKCDHVCYSSCVPVGRPIYLKGLAYFIS